MSLPLQWNWYRVKREHFDYAQDLRDEIAVHFHLRAIRENGCNREERTRTVMSTLRAVGINSKRNKS